MNPQVPQFADLNFAEKLELLETLWNQIAQTPEQLPVHDWQKEELDRRMAKFEVDPDSGVSWEEAKKRIRGSNDP